MIIKRKIDKDSLREMPQVFYPGNIEVIDTPQKADKAVALLEKETCVGIDSETRPSFKKGERHQVALLQVATRNRCFLFRLNIIGMTDSIIRFLEDKQIEKVGLSLHDDFLMMHRRSDFEPKGITELQEYVRLFGIQDMSLQKIYANLFKEKISKRQQLSNWEAPELTAQQLQYAAIDAWACLRIYKKLQSLQRNGDYQLEELSMEELTKKDQ